MLSAEGGEVALLVAEVCSVIFCYNAQQQLGQVVGQLGLLALADLSLNWVHLEA